MAHNIMNRAGYDHMFAVGEVGERDAVWHKLGQRCSAAVSWLEAMQLAGLNWTVEKRQLYGLRPAQQANLLPAAATVDAAPVPVMPLHSEYVPVESFGVFRTDDNAFLGAVGSKYHCIQNKDAFDFVDTLLEATDGAHYDSAGALGNGERIWCSAKVPFDFEPVPGDKHETYLIFSTSHDGQTSAICKLTTVRVVCQNTLNMAMSNSGSFVRIRHTQSAGERLGKAAMLMAGVGADVASLQFKLEQLAHVELTQEVIDRVLERMFPLPANGQASSRQQNITAEILSLYQHNDGGRIPGIAGTAYNLLNAATEYVDHFRSVKGANGDPERLKAARAEASLFGSGELVKQDALDIICDVVGVRSNN